jgi:hypothetical protein
MFLVTKTSTFIRGIKVERLETAIQTLRAVRDDLDAANRWGMGLGPLAFRALQAIKEAVSAYEATLTRD